MLLPRFFFCRQLFAIFRRFFAATLFFFDTMITLFMPLMLAMPPSRHYACRLPPRLRFFAALMPLIPACCLPLYYYAAAAFFFFFSRRLFRAITPRYYAAFVAVFFAARDTLRHADF